jgi:hypothetical protein
LKDKLFDPSEKKNDSAEENKSGRTNVNSRTSRTKAPDVDSKRTFKIVEKVYSILKRFVLFAC